MVLLHDVAVPRPLKQLFNIYLLPGELTLNPSTVKIQIQINFLSWGCHNNVVM